MCWLLYRLRYRDTKNESEDLAVGDQTTEDLGAQFLLQDLEIFSEATKLKKCSDVGQLLTLKKQNLMSVDGRGTELKLQENRSRDNGVKKIFIWEPRGKCSEIFKNKKVLITKIWPSSWFVYLIFSSSRDFKMQEPSYIYIYINLILSLLEILGTQCYAPRPWWIVMGNLKSKVSSIKKNRLLQTN